MKPIVSVVIPTYNHERYIAEALDSVLAQTYKDYEVIVVDDGSTDNTREVVKSYGDAVRYIYQQNKRMSAARNTGIRAAQGEYIAFLDSDDTWYPQKLEKQMKLFELYPTAGLINGGCVYVDVRGNTIATICRKDLNDRDTLFHALLLNNVLSGGSSNAVIKKECFELVGLFDENLKATAEDWDMWWRIFTKYDIRFAEECLVKILVKDNSVCSAINIAQMLPDELRMLDKLFSISSLKINLFDRRMAVSHRYFSAAWASKQIGDKNNARKYVMKSLIHNPIHFICRKDYIGLLLRILMGDAVIGIFCNINK